MKKIILGAFSAGLALSAMAGPSVYPTGTTRYDPAKAYNSFVLFSSGDNIAHLIDLNGNSVHEWKDTRDGEIVWEYVNPYIRVGKDAVTGRPTYNHQLYRGQPVPYDWVPAGTPHSEKPVVPPELGQYRVSATR